MVQVSLLLMLCLIAGLFARKFSAVVRIVLIIMMAAVVFSLYLS